MWYVNGIFYKKVKLFWSCLKIYQRKIFLYKSTNYDFSIKMPTSED